MRAGFALLVVGSLLGCAEPPPEGAVSPAEVAEHIHDWDGLEVTVEGWLGWCGGLDCHIYTSAADAELLDDPYADWTDEREQAFMRSLSIGWDPDFDAAAEPLRHSLVRIRARVNDDCWPSNCTDRAPDLEPISIEPLEAE